ncbi:MAG TPA: hypothetical protein VJ276_01160 [Thermoanaerobaculia bacterium]|nr:hypothetical protein [Thermoanaerobaculia bacterium]
MLRRIVLAILLASAVVPTLPRLLTEVRYAHELRALTPEQRRERMMGAFYVSTRRLDRDLPGEEPLALIIRQPSDLDSAIFFNYYVYPRRTRVYRTLGEYAMDRSPSRPRTIIAIGGDARRTSYEELRAERITDSVALAALPAEARQSFLIPMAVSLDGPPPDTYTTEATLFADREARVTITFYPSRATSELTLRAGETRRIRDLVYEQFRRMDAGWAEVRATAPIRASFFFVNRGAGVFAPLPPFTPARRFTLEGGGKLWLVNPSDRQVVARVNGEARPLAPRVLISMPAARSVEADAPIYAFLSERQPDGNTRFVWP